MAEQIIQGAAHTPRTVTVEHFLQRSGNLTMSKDTKIVIGIVLLALVCSSLPFMTLLVMGRGEQNARLWDQIPGQFDGLTIFTSMTLGKLVDGALLIPLIGLALSLYYRPRNRKKFQLTSVAFALLLIGTIFLAMLSSWLEINYNQQAVSAQQRAAGYSAVNCVSALVNLISWIILLYALFSSRFNPNNENSDIKMI